MTIDTSPTVSADLADTASVLPTTKDEAVRLDEDGWVAIVSALAALLGAWDDEEVNNQPIADDGSLVIDSALGLCVATYVTTVYGSDFGDLATIAPSQWRTACGVAGIIQRGLEDGGE